MRKKATASIRGSSLKKCAKFCFTCKPPGTISSVAKHFFRATCCKSVAKTISQKVPSPERRINTGFFGTPKPKGTTPTPKYKTGFNCFCLGIMT